MREALRQLQAIGLVDQLGHRGAVVRRFSPEECRNVYLVRAELEGLAAERSAGRLTGYDKADLDVAQALLRTGYERHRPLAPDDEAGLAILCEQWSQANELFHNVILAAASCPPLRDTVQSLQNSRPALDRVAHVRRRPGHHPPQRRRPRPHRRGAGQAATPAAPAGCCTRTCVETGATAARWLERQAA